MYVMHMKFKTCTVHADHKLDCCYEGILYYQMLKKVSSDS